MFNNLWVFDIFVLLPAIIMQYLYDSVLYALRVWVSFKKILRNPRKQFEIMKVRVNRYSNYQELTLYVAVYYDKRLFGYYTKDRSLNTRVIQNPNMLLPTFFSQYSIYLIHRLPLTPINWDAAMNGTIGLKCVLRSAYCLTLKRHKKRNVFKK